jgi:hypothetical protein
MQLPLPSARTRSLDARINTVFGLARPFLRRAVLIFAVSTVVALLLTAIRNDSFADNWVYSMCVGMACWFFIQAGWLSGGGGAGAPPAAAPRGRRCRRSAG